MSWTALISPLSSIIGKVVDKVAPDAGMAEKLKAEITHELLKADSDALKKQADIIMSEANGASWLQRNWRPLVMINFAVLITAHWLGFTPENMSDAQVLALLDIVQVGLGGYVVGRSAEKVMREYKK